MQRDVGINLIEFIASLPFGLYHVKRNIDLLQRHHTMPAGTAAAVIPRQSDFAGHRRPRLLTVGRKGQICRFDPAPSSANKYNGLIAGGTGAGKSFTVNAVAYNMWLSGDKVAILDLGYSYEKLCRLCGGRFIDVTSQGQDSLSLNPFTNLSDVDAEGNNLFQNEASVLADVMHQIAYSASGIIPEEHKNNENQLLRAAVTWAWERYRQDADIRNVYEFLRTYPKHASRVPCEAGADIEDLSQHDRTAMAHRLAGQITEFAYGAYAAWFTGPSDFDIRNDRFVVLELQQIRQQKELFRVVTAAVLQAVMNDLYLGDPSIRRFIIFEEAHEWIRAGQASDVAQIIEQGYRRARKHKGSFWICTQRPSDLHDFGRTGQVIQSQAETKIFMESDDFELAREHKVIDCTDFELALLKKMKSRKRYYSEMCIQSGDSMGFTRLLVDPYSYWVFTSDPDDKVEINKLKRLGMPYDEIFDLLVEAQENQACVNF